MTGKDLIIYILTNNLENEPVYKDGKFIGFITAGEAAIKLDVGVATIYTMVHRKQIPGIIIGDTVHIPANFKVKNEGA